MQKKINGLLFILCILFSLPLYSQQKNLVPYVNPFIGTGGHAHTFPGACYPFGMMQLSPDTRITGWDGCSGYYYSDTAIYGFTHTHLSGTGCLDYGDILLMPVPHIPMNPGGNMLSMADYYSPYSKSTEKASPGYYSVVLKNGNIKAELTVGKYAGIHRYVFGEKGGSVILDLEHRNKILDASINWVSDTELTGYRETTGWAKDRKLYFDIRFSKHIATSMMFNGHLYMAGKKSLSSKEGVKAGYDFYTDTLLVKIGISAVSIENAKENLVHDIPAWDFDGTLKKTRKAWNDYLNKIEVTTKNDSLLTTFYTALYHTAIHPSLFTDVNGQYLGRDMKTHTAKNFSMYTIFSIWDTYRALHPLYTIIDSSMDRQFIQTFLKQYEQGGALPVWELAANETNCMIAYHSVSIIADAYQKGIRGFDAREALDAMEHSSNSYTRAKGLLREYGYIPADKCSESVSQTLECAYDDWCIAQMGKMLGLTELYKTHMEVAQSYKNVFNPNNDFMQGRDNGRFCVPFDPTAVTFNYTEANAWQYNFYVPQDVSGLIALYGSKEKLAEKLDTLFTTSTQMQGRTQPDITGMLGQYAQGNEPSHHIAYLYNYVGQPWKTAKYIHKLEKFYTNQPDGICGNDDCGELSAWYVMSAIGMYQVCPGDGQFELTTPLFDTVKIHLESGKTFSITCSTYDNKPNSIYVYGASLNGRQYDKSYLLYKDILGGGNLSLYLVDTIYGLVTDSMGNNRRELLDWGTGNNVPVDSISSNESIVPIPYVENGQTTVTDSVLIHVESYSPSDSIHFLSSIVTANGNATEFTEPHFRKAYWYSFPDSAYNDSLAYYAYRGNKHSITGITTYTKISQGRKIKITSTPNPQYTAGGPNALLDFQHGNTDFKLGKWQGYQYQDFEAVVDLGKTEEVHNLSAEFLQDALSYIFMPTYVDFSVSTDSIHFTPVAHITNTVPDTLTWSAIKTMGKDIPAQKVRYIKVFAKNYGKLPPWHPGYGDGAFIFIDEIEIK